MSLRMPRWLAPQVRWPLALLVVPSRREKGRGSFVAPAGSVC